MNFHKRVQRFCFAPEGVPEGPTGGEEGGITFDAPGDDNTGEIAEQLMGRWAEDAGETTPADAPQDGKPTGSEETAPASETPTQASDAPPEAPKPVALADDALVQIGDKAIPFSQLRDFATQSAAVQDRAGAITAEQQRLASVVEQYKTQANGVKDFWQSQWDELAKIDPRTAARELTEAQYQAYSDECNRVATGLAAAKASLEGAEKTGQTINAALDREQAVACWNTLSDPVSGIPGFGKERYEALGQYAVKNGVALEDFARERNPLVLKLLDKAARYDAGLAGLAQVQKTPTTPTPANKGTAARSEGGMSSPQDARARLVKSGTVEDAMAAIEAAWSAQSKQ